MAADGSIIIDTRVDTSGIRSGMSGAERTVSRSADKMKRSLNGLGSAAKKIGLLIGKPGEKETGSGNERMCRTWL